MSLYIGQPVTIRLSCIVDGQPMDDAVSAQIAYQKPSKATGVWNATVNNPTGLVQYEMTPDDNNAAGTWKLQALPTFPGSPDNKSYPGTPVEMVIKKRFT